MGVYLDDIPCLAKYLCDKPNGLDYCKTMNHDSEACPQYSRDNVMNMKPDEVHCADRCKCKLAGIREGCRDTGGHIYCGPTTNGNIPEGDVPDSRLDKIRKVLPQCALAPVS